MRKRPILLVLAVIVCLGSWDLGAQQLTPVPEPPPVAPGTVRLYLAMDDGYRQSLIIVPPVRPVGSCSEVTSWQRTLEGDLNGTTYAISLKARSNVRPANQPSDPTIPLGKIRATILIEHPTEPALPPHYVERLREWARENVRPNAPRQPDPSNYFQWQTWANRNTRQFLPPALSELDREFRRKGLPVRGEIVLATADFQTRFQDRVLTATLTGPDPEARAGDALILNIQSLADGAGSNCVWPDSDGLAYIDIPETPLTESPLDAANRWCIITGTVATPDGAPLAGKQVLFQVVDEEGRGMTTVGTPDENGLALRIDPIAGFDAQGGFTLRVPVNFFLRSAEKGTGLVQVVEPIGPIGDGQLRRVGAGTLVKLGNPGQTRINLGRVVVDSGQPFVSTLGAGEVIPGVVAVR